jgi:hypothetical protein
MAEIGTIANRSLIKESVKDFVEKTKSTRVFKKVNEERFKVQNKIKNQQKKI